MTAFCTHQVHLVARLLVALVLAESDPTCRESQLHALGELAAAGRVDPDGLHPLRQLVDAELEPSAAEHLQYLLTDVLGGGPPR